MCKQCGEVLAAKLTSHLQEQSRVETGERSFAIRAENHWRIALSDALRRSNMASVAVL